MHFVMLWAGHPWVGEQWTWKPPFAWEEAPVHREPFWTVLVSSPGGTQGEAGEASGSEALWREV